MTHKKAAIQLIWMVAFLLLIYCFIVLLFQYPILALPEWRQALS